MKERIINESIESLRREGLKFSIDTLAERLNISKKTVYKYFSNKEELAFALYRKYFADAKEQAKRLAQENSLSARKQLLHLCLDAKYLTCVDIFNKKARVFKDSQTPEVDDNGKHQLQLLPAPSHPKAKAPVRRRHTNH